MDQQEHPAPENAKLGFEAVLDWLAEEDETRLQTLWRQADETRRRFVGEAVHLRGLVEISSHCRRLCAYCGLRADNAGVTRYRMTADEVLACARQAVAFGYGTLVMQSGEDPGLTASWVAELIRQIKAETRLAVTLSLGERETTELALWRQAGADRYLLRFETSNPDLYRQIHPAHPRGVGDRTELLRSLRDLGYEIGSGVMVGIPGQTLGDLARDILVFQTLALDMIGVGPFIPHPATPLAAWRPSPAERPATAQPADRPVPNTEAMTLKTVALARLACPWANIPSTTALATIDPAQGREKGLQCGANVVMPNLTPPHYRAAYEIYPGKACVSETAEACCGCLHSRIFAINRTVGSGPGGSRRGERP